MPNFKRKPAIFILFALMVFPYALMAQGLEAVFAEKYSFRPRQQVGFEAGIGQIVNYRDYISRYGVGTAVNFTLTAKAVKLSFAFQYSHLYLETPPTKAYIFNDPTDETVGRTYILKNMLEAPFFLGATLPILKKIDIYFGAGTTVGWIRSRNQRTEYFTKSDNTIFLEKGKSEKIFHSVILGIHARAGIEYYLTSKLSIDVHIMNNGIVQVAGFSEGRAFAYSNFVLGIKKKIGNENSSTLR